MNSKDPPTIITHPATTHCDPVDFVMFIEKYSSRAFGYFQDRTGVHLARPYPEFDTEVMVEFGKPLLGKKAMDKGKGKAGPDVAMTRKTYEDKVRRDVTLPDPESREDLARRSGISTGMVLNDLKSHPGATRHVRQDGASREKPITLPV
ncbi:hypothetical protein VE03_09172 [Pseudogymnoascus sp. 23342-1-I1]|nr:hypothetical protein VE03_09172 [Pseudogymnoascus sp. 23342-1-I1]